MKKIKYWLRSFLKIKTVGDAKKMELKHFTNIHGDEINRINCRSIWEDEFGYQYRCDELLPGGRDIVMDKIMKELDKII